MNQLHPAFLHALKCVSPDLEPEPFDIYSQGFEDMLHDEFGKVGPLIQELLVYRAQTKDIEPEIKGKLDRLYELCREEWREKA